MWQVSLKKKSVSPKDKVAGNQHKSCKQHGGYGNPEYLLVVQIGECGGLGREAYFNWNWYFFCFTNLENYNKPENVEGKEREVEGQ